MCHIHAHTHTHEHRSQREIEMGMGINKQECPRRTEKDQTKKKEREGCRTETI